MLALGTIRCLIVFQKSGKSINDKISRSLPIVINVDTTCLLQFSSGKDLQALTFDYLAEQYNITTEKFLGHKAGVVDNGFF